MGETATHIGESEAYWNEVERLGDCLLREANDQLEHGPYDQRRTAILELADEVLFPHPLFDPYANNGRVHGAIIECGEADMEQWGCNERIDFSQHPDAILRDLARQQFWADCVEHARDKAAQEAAE